jgi:hypothetical protein
MADAGTVYNPFLYEGSDAQLQQMILLGVCVAGKVARQQEAKLGQFFENLRKGSCKDCATPFEAIRCITSCRGGRFQLEMELRHVKMGQYSRIVPAFAALAESDLDLRTCSREDLCKIHGIGMKTASFFILFTRRDSNVACLDVHILAWMRETGLAPDAPKSSPDRITYLLLEAIFLNYCKQQNRPPGEVDFEIWLARNRGDKNVFRPKLQN